MTDTKWTLHGREFANCNCSYGCPCQFNALPTYGKCWAVIGIQIDEGHHGDVPLKGLKVAGIFKYPGAIHMGNGEAVPIVDKRATEAQRNALLRIMSGQDTKPGATMFHLEFEAADRLDAEHRIRIEPVGGFEFKVAEIGRGWTKTTGPISYELADSYGQFAELHLCQDGIVN